MSDCLCNSFDPSVYLFRSDKGLRVEAIKPGAILVINKALTPVDGSLIVATLRGEFRLVRFRTSPPPHLEELDNPDRRLPLTGDEVEAEEGSVCFGVITHVLNDMRANIEAAGE